MRPGDRHHGEGTVTGKTVKREKINVGDLRLGMYVAELDRPWLETPFLFQGFLITSEDELTQLGQVCRFVYVDAERSEPGVVDEARRAGKTTTSERAVESHNEPRPVYQRSFEQEFSHGKDVFRRARDRIKRVYEALRGGRNLDVADVEATVNELTDSITRNPDVLILLSSLKHTDQSLGDHALAVCTLSLTLGYHTRLTRSALYELGVGALLHDIGQTRIPQALLQKRGRLSAEEREQLESHPAIGAEIIKNTHGLPDVAAEVALCHHERLDGSGYPRGLKGEAIPLFARIVGLANLYDDLTGGRHGRAQLTSTEALKSLYDWRGRLFDETLVAQFIQCLGIYPVGTVVALHSGEVGVVISVSTEKRLTPRLLLLRDQNNHPYDPPRVINLAQYHEEGKRSRYEINRVLDPASLNIDLRAFVLRELQF